jgi:replication factor C subunit 3/5
MGVDNGSGRLDDSKITIVPPDWEVYIQQVADAVIGEQSPQRYVNYTDVWLIVRILQVRTMLYELLTHCIPPTTIIKVRSFLA